MTSKRPSGSRWIMYILIDVNLPPVVPSRLATSFISKLTVAKIPSATPAFTDITIKSPPICAEANISKPIWSSIRSEPSSFQSRTWRPKNRYSGLFQPLSRNKLRPRLSKPKLRLTRHRCRHRKLQTRRCPNPNVFADFTLNVEFGQVKHDKIYIACTRE